MKGKVLIFLLMVLWMLTIFSLGANFFQDQQNFRFRIERLILDFADNGSANVIIDDYGLGYVLFNEYSYGNNGQISFFLPFGQGKGIFSIGTFVDGWEVSEGFASIDAFMITTFRFNFDVPEDIPLEAVIPDSIGFVLFLEGRTNAWAHGALPVGYPGYASASGSFTTELISASAYISAFFPNSPPYFDVYDYDPEQGYKRDAVIKTVDITSGQGEYVVEFSGSAATMNFNAMSVGSAYARTGIVVLSGVDPLGIPEVGDNEFVYQETAWREPLDGGIWHHYVRLFIPARVRIVCGFTPDKDLLEWLKRSLDWYIQPQIATDHYHDKRFENGYSEFEIFPIFGEGELYLSRIEGLLFTDVYLPENIDDFGKKRIILTFNNQDVHAANIEIFFPATGTLHPPGGPEGCFLIGPIHLWSITTPNWMYYYWQIYPNQQVKYANSNYSFYYEGQDHVHIGNDVIYGHADGIDGLGRRWETYIPEPPYSDVSPIFAYQVYGIDAYVRAVAHELEHKRIYDEYHALIEQASQNGITLDDPNDDYDGDGLPNFVEWQVGTDPERRYTLGIGWFDDNELLANFSEYNVFGDKNKDWSDQGLNKGVPRQRVLIRQVR
jgi:hypothetical protein